MYWSHCSTGIHSFATLSCISSLAVAPMLPVWRLRPDEYYAKELRRGTAADLHSVHAIIDWGLLEGGGRVTPQRQKVEAAQSRERVILALALLTQVVLQWTWGIILFVSPVYKQPECSGDTVLMLFFSPFTVRRIRGAKFAVWPMWLLFCLAVTLGLLIILSLTSPHRAQYSLSRHSSFSSMSTNTLRASLVELARSYPAAPPLVAPSPTSHHPFWKGTKGTIVVIGNIISFSLWALYIFGM